MNRELVLLTVCMLVILRILSVTGEFELAQASPYTDIDVDAAHNMITNGSYPDLTLLDVRTKNEYDSGHIYGAVWIPVTELKARIDELAGHEDHEIIVYCLSGGRSATASGILDSYNFTKVYNMLGGISAWESVDYPSWIATVHNLNSNYNYDTIQAAINANQTLDGHTIFVEAGTYYERVTINKENLTITGEDVDTTIIDGGNRGLPVIEVYTDNTKITGFTLQNGGPCCHGSGIQIHDSIRTKVIANKITQNRYGILFLGYSCCPRSCIYHNNFINNTYSMGFKYGDWLQNITWDNGYPSGGNYWSDYNGTDLDGDGIGDTPYQIDVNNTDDYPLMGIFSDFNVTSEHHVLTICNSSISDFKFNGTAISFNVYGDSGTSGFCRICIPKALMNNNFTVLVNGTQADYDILPCPNDTHNYLYFTYNHSIQEVIIILEFPSLLILPLFMIATLIATTVYFAIRKPKIKS